VWLVDVLLYCNVILCYWYLLTRKSNTDCIIVLYIPLLVYSLACCSCLSQFLVISKAHMVHMCNAAACESQTMYAFGLICTLQNELIFSTYP
jgi:hypothetical protein